MSKQPPIASASGKANDTWVRPYFGKYRGHMGAAIALGVLTLAFAGLLMFAAGYLISRCAERPEEGLFVVLAPIAFVQIFGIGKPILRYIERLLSHDWVFRMTSDLRLRLYAALESQAMRLRHIGRTGDFLGLVAEDIGHLQNLYLRTIFPVLIGWLLLAAVSIFNGVFDVRFAMALLAVLAIVAFALPLLSLHINRNRIEGEKSLRNQLYADLADNVIGSSDWVFAGRGADYLASIKADGKKAKRLKESLNAYYRVNDLVAILVLTVGAVIVFAWAAHHFGADGAPRANWIAAFVLGYFPLIEAFMPLTASVTQVNVYRDSTKRLNEYPAVADEDLGVDLGTADTSIALSFSIDELMGGGRAKKAAAPEVSPTEQGAGSGQEQAPAESASALDVDIEGVSFAYEEGRAVLDGVDLHIAAGEKVAVLGKSGSGKSTLASLVRGDNVPASGKVLIGGEDVSELAEDMHSYLGVVQQSPYLFNRTLRENLQIGREDATDAEIAAALEAVGLGGLLERLGQGLDTMVDEAGMRFSGGERHRIAFARVLLANVGVVLLDEPTVGLDPVTEAALLGTLFEVARNKTLIMITHHLQDIERFDRVVFIEDGRVEMDGSPAQLAASSKRYQQLRAFDLGISKERLAV